jgi:acyl-CoA thioester hydrolase
MTLETYTRDQFKHWTSVDVRWGELDSYGHVNNVVYFSYFEDARARYMLDLGVANFLSGEACLQIIVNCAMNFRREVRFPAQLEIGTRITDVGRSSYLMHCGIFFKDSDMLSADGTGRMVCVNPATKRPMPVPDDFLDAMQRHEGRVFPRSAQ